MQNIRKLVGAVAHDDAALHDLLHDPSALTRALNMPAEHVAALRRRPVVQNGEYVTQPAGFIVAHYFSAGEESFFAHLAGR